jgi:hypothetical protein
MLPTASMLQVDTPDPNAMLAAAKAFAERARARVTNAAA